MTDQQSMPQPDSDKDEDPALNQPDWYLENGFVVFTAAYHLKRRCCCGSGCRHCPFEPRHVEGNTHVRQ